MDDQIAHAFGFGLACGAIACGLFYGVIKLADKLIDIACAKTIAKLQREIDMLHAGDVTVVIPGESPCTK